MNNKQITLLFGKLKGKVSTGRSMWNLYLKGIKMTCYTDEIHNRIRIVSFIKPLHKTTSIEMIKCMEANFHTAIDVKYATSENQLCAVFLHPLKELSTPQLQDAINQLYLAVENFGTTFSSGHLHYDTKSDIQRKWN